MSPNIPGSVGKLLQGMSPNIPENVVKYSGECPETFQEMSPNIPGNVLKHSGGCHQTFKGMSPNIQGNVLKHSGECSQTLFPGMFGDIPRNVWGHSSEYNISPISRVPRIPFTVPVFLVLYIAKQRLCKKKFWNQKSSFCFFV